MAARKSPRAITPDIPINKQIFSKKKRKRKESLEAYLVEVKHYDVC